MASMWRSELRDGFTVPVSVACILAESQLAWHMLAASCSSASSWQQLSQQLQRNSSICFHRAGFRASQSQQKLL